MEKENEVKENNQVRENIEGKTISNENNSLEEGTTTNNEVAKEVQPVQESTMSKEFVDSKEKNFQKFIPLILTIAIVIGAVGLYLTLYGSPKRIVANGIDKVSTEFKNILSLSESTNNIKDNYTVEGNFDIKASSEYITALGSVSTDYVAYSKMLDNLNKTENKFKIVQDKTNKKLFATIDSTLNSDELISAKYLIENSTEYYFIKGFLNTYVNNGTNDYFEALDNNADSYENAIYVYDVAIKSFKENLKSEYFTKSSEEVTIDGKKQKLIKNSLVINNKVAKEIATGVLKNLKEDKKASEILTGYDKGFKNSKIKSNEELLDSKEELNINVYTDSLTYSAKIYELILKNENGTYGIKYQDSKDSAKLEILDNDQVQAILNIKEESSTKTNIEIVDGENNKLGEATITNTATNKNIILNITSDNTTLDLSINSITKEEQANKIYSTEGTISCKITSDNMEIINLTIGINTTTSDDANIEEDVSESVLASTVSTTDQNNLNNKLGEILLKLMS